MLSAVATGGGPTDYIGPARLAEAHLVLGDRETALALLEKDSGEGGDHSLWARYQGPVFDPIREEPRFVTLLRAMHLPTTVVRRPSGDQDPPAT